MEQKYPELKKERETLQKLIGDIETVVYKYSVLEADWEWFFENSLDIKCIVNLEGYFTRVNPAMCKILGFSAQELTSQPIFNFIHPDDIESTKAELKKLLNGQNTVRFDNRYRDKKGDWHWISWCCPPYTEDSKQLYAIARDITESKQTQEQLLYQAMHDPLTGLRNRASLDYELHQAIARCCRNSGLQLMIFSIDLNDFKAINDTHGHIAGDYVLKEVARRFKQIKRKDDLIFRLGGDEFIWISEGEHVTHEDVLLQKIVGCLNQPVAYNLLTLPISGSVGYVCYQGEECTAESLLEQADLAMYQDKKG